MTDLWPEDIALVEAKAPVAILKEQAAIIGRRTKGLVEGDVASLEPGFITSYAQGSVAYPKGSGVFAFSFSLRAPALHGYTFRMFGMWYDASLYPVRISLDRDIAAEVQNSFQVHRERLAPDYEEHLIVAESEEHYLEFLTAVFSSNKVRRVIGAILSQSQGERSL